jgi:hypothetical protein
MMRKRCAALPITAFTYLVQQPNAVTEEDVEALDGDAVTASSDADVKIVFPEHQNLGLSEWLSVFALLLLASCATPIFSADMRQISLPALL